MSRWGFYDAGLTYEDNFNRGPAGELPEWKPVGKPTKDFFGIPVYEPFGVAAGPLLRGSFVVAAHRAGFDLAVYKTVRSRPQPCHPWPNVVEVEERTITNSFGVPSRSPGWWLSDLEATVGACRPGQVVLGSFQGDDVEDYVLAAGLVKQTGVPVLVANISCPNLDRGLICDNPYLAGEVAARIRQVVGNRVLLLKIGYTEGVERLLGEVAHSVDGIIAINAVPVQTNRLSGRSVSGVCGAAIRDKGLEMVRRIASWGLPVVGCGGVMTPADYYEYLEAGACAVLVGAGAMYDPGLAIKIKKEI